MFVAAIEFLFERRMDKWKYAIDDSSEKTRASQLIALTGKDLGEQGLYRIIFAALCETDDSDVRHVLRRLYQRYHERVKLEITKHREQESVRDMPDENDTAWTLIGLVAFMNIALDLDLMSARKREQLFFTMTTLLLNGERQ